MKEHRLSNLNGSRPSKQENIREEGNDADTAGGSVATNTLWFRSWSASEAPSQPASTNAALGMGDAFVADKGARGNLGGPAVGGVVAMSSSSL